MIHNSNYESNTFPLQINKYIIKYKNDILNTSPLQINKYIIKYKNDILNTYIL